MASLCSPRATTIGRAVVIAGLTLIVIVPAMAMVWVRTPWARGEHHNVVQPVAFDHRVHVTGLRIDCRYCHADAERTASAEQVAPLTMGSCLDCHRDPEPRLRPLADITTMGWRHAPSDTSGARLVGQGDRIRRPHRVHDLSSLGRDGCRVETSGRTRRNARVPARRGRSARRGLAARLSDAARRGRGTRVVVGGVLGLIVGIGQFAIPFVLLLPRNLKRRPRFLAGLGGWLLAMHLLEVYWLVLPAINPAGVSVSWLDVAPLLMIGGFSLAVVCWRARREPALRWATRISRAPCATSSRDRVRRLWLMSVAELA